MNTNIQWFDHQKKVLQDTQFCKNVGLFLDMGLGKSLLSCAIMERYQTPYNLCVCQKSKVKDFVDMFKEQGFTVYDWTDKRQNHLKPGIIVINYELAWRREKLKELSNFTMILDESSKIMHPDTKQTQFIMSMKADHVILCSGSPCNGRYENLWTQCKLLGYNVPSTDYWNNFVVWVLADRDIGRRTIHYKKVLGYKNVETLKDVLSQHGAVFMKSDEVIKLPPSIDTTVKVSQTSDYKKFAKDRVVFAEGEWLTGDNILTARLRLRQLSSSYNQDKLNAFSDLLESCEDRLVVFYQFQRDFKMLGEICAKHDRPISVVNGSIKDLSNYENYDRTVTLVQFQSGSFGLNLQKANKIIFFCPPESSDTYTQARARIRRIGQNRTCFYWHLVQENSIEEKIYDAIQHGMDYTNLLFMDDYKELCKDLPMGEEVNE